MNVDYHTFWGGMSVYGVTGETTGQQSDNHELYRHFGAGGKACHSQETDSDMDNDSGIVALSRLSSSPSSVISLLPSPAGSDIGDRLTMDSPHESGDESGYHTFLACDDEEEEIEVVPLQHVARAEEQPEDDIILDSADAVSMMKDLQGRLERHLQQFEQQASWAAKKEHTLREKRSQIMHHLKERRDYLHQMIDRWYSKTVVSLQTVTSQELDSLTQQREEAERNAVMLSGACQAAKSLLTGNLQEDGVTERMRAIAPRLQQLDMTPRAQPQQHHVCFQLSCESIWDYNSMFGSLSITRITDSPDSMISPFTAVCHPDMKFCFNARESASHCLTGDYMATGISLTTDGNMIVSDIGTDSVKLFSSQGRLLEELCVLPDDHPSQAVALPNGRVAVACKSDVRLFLQKGGDFIRGLQQNFFSPQAVTLIKKQDQKGQTCLHLAVAEVMENNVPVINIYEMDSFTLVNKFSTDNPHSYQLFTDETDPTMPKFSHSNPWYLCGNSSGDIVCTDLSDQTVKAFSQEGKLLWVRGGKGCGPGQFFMPAGLCEDAFGHLLVADCANNRICLLSPQGEPLSVVVREEDGLESPTDVAVTVTGDLVVLQGDGHVKRFKYLH